MKYPKRLKTEWWDIGWEGGIATEWLEAAATVTSGFEDVTDTVSIGAAASQYGKK